MKSKSNDVDILELDEIDTLLDRSMATANLLALCHAHFGKDLADATVPTAAHGLYNDLLKLKVHFAKLVDKIEQP